MMSIYLFLLRPIPDLGPNYLIYLDLSCKCTVEDIEEVLSSCLLYFMKIKKLTQFLPLCLHLSDESLPNLKIQLISPKIDPIDANLKASRISDGQMKKRLANYMSFV